MRRLCRLILCLFACILSCARISRDLQKLNASNMQLSVQDIPSESNHTPANVTVSCGNHRAASCKECSLPNKGAGHCHGQCGWNYTKKECVSREEALKSYEGTVSCGGNRAPSCEHCGGGPPGCNGECTYNFAAGTCVSINQYNDWLKRRSLPQLELLEAKLQNAPSISVSPRNLHRHYAIDWCDDSGTIDMSKVDNSSKAYRNIMPSGHISTGAGNEGVKKLVAIQSCQYSNLAFFNELADKHKLRWSPHGGSIISALCHRSISPWDDDIDITVASCDRLVKIYKNADPNITRRYPDLESQAYIKGWSGRLVNDRFLLYGTGSSVAGKFYWKLKPVSQALHNPTSDPSGMDIQCYPGGIAGGIERIAEDRSGFLDFLRNTEPLQKLEFGPTHIHMVPDDIARRYIVERFGKTSFCDHAFDRKLPGAKPMSRMPRASQIEVILSRWFVPFNVRKILSDPSRKMNSTVRLLDLYNKLEDLDSVEIDNSIASQSSCKAGLPGHRLHVFELNDDDDVHWSEVASRIRDIFNLQMPDIIVWNKADIGMARSGNIHTARQLAFELGMNYGWGLEFLETRNATNVFGLQGRAILTNCYIHDTMIGRGDGSDVKKSAADVGSGIGLFIKFGASTKNDGSRIVLGSLDKNINPSKNISQFEKFKASFPVILVEDEATFRCSQWGLMNLTNACNTVCVDPGTREVTCSRKRPGLFRYRSLYATM